MLSPLPCPALPAAMQEEEEAAAEEERVLYIYGGVNRRERPW